MRHDRHGPIGVFDSGVGGLTVLKALIDRLPLESTVYLGDTARVPYGTKSGEVVTKYSLANADVLLEYGIKLLVVACNTASAVALPALREALPVPVVGVISPGASVAAATTKSGRVAVIGTPGTIASGAYQRALEVVRPGLELRTRACPLFVPLAEEGWVAGDVPRLVAERYLGDGLLSGGVDTLVLGCTHYPLLQGVIHAVAGPGVTLVDSARATADRVAEVLHERDLVKKERLATERHYLVTDTPARFAEVGARFLGHPISGASQIDLKLRG
ncbi:MAG: glutamate racemase [Myxococcaceae bacterium]|jgi:glutamate racemase|nr:glutamate racemase [Myxococcaceae bacterium]